MIYLLSDIHAGETSAIDGLRRYFEIAGNDDILIILGDVGARFEDTDQNREFDELFLSSTKKIAFLDGNHENFAYINSFPEEDWSGGRVHRLTDNIVHLERGYVYEIEGKRFFTFGGCASSKIWREKGPWYPEESASKAELLRAYSTLSSVKEGIDYVLTHKYETEGIGEDEELLRLTEYIEKNVPYKHWYAGHWHEARERDEKHSFIFDALVSLG